MQEVYNQLFCLLIFIITGIAIGILFDVFRILRKSFKTADWITSLQDVLFWILAGCIMLFSIFVFNNGEFRSYVFIGMIIGIIFYMLTISKIFIKASTTIINFLKKTLSYPINLIKNIFTKFILNPICSLLNKIKKIHFSTKFNKKNNENGKKIKEKEGIF